MHLRWLPFLLLGNPLSIVVQAKVTFYRGHDAESPGCTPSHAKILTAALAEGEEAIHTAVTALQHSSEPRAHKVCAELFAQTHTSKASGTLQKVLNASKNPTSDITLFCNENHIIKLPDPHSNVPVWTDTAWSTTAGKLLPQVQTSWAEADGWKNTDAKNMCEMGFSAYTVGINSLPDQAQLDASKMRDSSQVMLTSRMGTRIVQAGDGEQSEGVAARECKQLYVAGIRRVPRHPRDAEHAWRLVGWQKRREILVLRLEARDRVWHQAWMEKLPLKRRCALHLQRTKSVASLGLSAYFKRECGGFGSKISQIYEEAGYGGATTKQKIRLRVE
ncbi:hypothetical protein MMC26_003699 [Xylographa opegraphella]|nr:hypothetical protein [Xylographa opegraphella]